MTAAERFCLACGTLIDEPGIGFQYCSPACLPGELLGPPTDEERAAAKAEREAWEASDARKAKRKAPRTAPAPPSPEEAAASRRLKALRSLPVGTQLSIFGGNT